MSAVQAKIPFKSRKKVGLVYKNAKNNVENINTTNTPKIQSQLKRRGNYQKYNDEDEDISPKKKCRLIHEESGINDENSINAEPKLRPLPSRETEISFLENFLCERADKQESASLYISGQPGTGKTACLNYILQTDKIKECYKQVSVNCLMMKSAASIYNRICKELQLRVAATSEKACLAAIEKYLVTKHKMILLVLDEIDQLDSRKQSILYTIFEWASLPFSRIVLIGIANALDLTERALPRLQARVSMKPLTLHFAPYTKQQIVNIFTTILAEEDKTSVFSPVALQMLAAKISAVSGDMRRALDIGRRVMELAKRNKFKENKCLDTLMNDSSVTVELKQVLEVLNDVYGGSSNIDSDVNEGLPMQQKLILCSLILMIKGKNKDIVVGRLHDVYKKVSRSRNIAPLDVSEMLSACALLESRGAVRVCAGAGGARSRKLRLQWDAGELSAALADKPLLAAIMQDSSLS